MPVLTLCKHEVPVEDEIPTLTTKNEPAVGEKRSRDDDEQHDIRSPSLEHASRPNPATQPPHNEAYNSNGMGPGMLQQNMMLGHDMSGMDGNDALYIGDLQWVRLFTVIFLVHSMNSALFIVDHRRGYSCHSRKRWCNYCPQRYNFFRAQSQR